MILKQQTILEEVVRLFLWKEKKKYLEEHSFVEAGFVIVTLEDNKMIGTVSLEQIDDINRNATLGIFIGDKKFQKQRIWNRSDKINIEYGFKYLNLHNIKLDLMEFNERALKCYKNADLKNTEEEDRVNL